MPHDDTDANAREHSGAPQTMITPEVPHGELLARYEADLRRFLVESLGPGYEEIERDTPLLEYGILDSILMQSLLAFIEDRYHVPLPPEEVRPESFGTLQEMARTVAACAQREHSGPGVRAFEVINALMESYGLRRRWVEVPSGRQHLLTNHGASPPLFLLSGLGSPASSWGTLLRSLNGRRRAVALDLPGFGVSEEPVDGDYSFPAQVRTAIAVLDALDEGPWVLVGNSAGAMISAEIARLRPDLALGLVVISFGRVGNGPMWWKELSELSAEPDRFWQRAFRNPPPLSAGLRQQLATTLASRAYREFLDATTLDRLDRIFAGLELPALFLGGVDDGIIPLSVVESGARQVPGARFEQLVRCGHYAQSERSEEVLVYIQHFLSNELGI